MCTSPMLAKYVYDNKTQSFGYRFVSKSGANSVSFHDRHNGNGVLDLDTGELHDNYIRIPCGNCFECRLKYSKDWSTRMLCEAANFNFENCYFLTLTYDNNNLRKGPTGNPTVCKDDIKKFMNSIRDSQLYNFKNIGVRYYGSTEYGEKCGRPHCHIIIFNCKIPPDGLKFYMVNSFNQPLYKGLYFEKYWPYGFVTVGALSFESCAYVARYCMKKHKGRDACYYDDLGIEPESCCMSNRPGIGRRWFEDNYKNIYLNENGNVVDSIYFPPSAFLDSKAKRLPIPSYFDDLLEDISPDVYNKVKSTRQLKANNAEDMHYYMIGDGFNSDYFAANSAKYNSIAKKLSKFCV